MVFGIIGCVLALVVPIVVGLALHISCQRTIAELRAQLAKCSAELGTSATSYLTLNARFDGVLQRLTACETGLTQTSGSHLARVVADLAADVEAIAASNRKNFGRVFAELHQDGALKRNGAKQQRVPVDDIDDPELEHMIALQNALPSSPSKS